MARFQNTFTVVIDGIELSEEAVNRLNEALQKAVLNEMASVDLRGKQLIFQPVMGKMVADRESAGGNTGGAQITVAGQ